MKVVFLDVDGVLNSEEFVLRKVEQNGLENVHGDFPRSEFCPILVAHLNTLLNATKAKIVFSSSWRHGRSLSNIQELLDSVGVYGEVISKTPDLPNLIRGHEIKEWLTFHPEVSSFVIIDDDDDMLPEQLSNFVQTDFRKGLSLEKVKEAIKILNG